MAEKSKNVYVTIHKSFVREGIEYEGDTFNSVTLPRGTVINGRDVSFYQFKPLFVNDSRRGEDWRDIPLLKYRDVWLRKTLMDEDNQPIRDAEGRKQYDTVIVAPGDIKAAIDQQRRDYLDSLKDRSLHDRADAVTRSSRGRQRDTQRRQQDMAPEDIPF